MVNLTRVVVLTCILFFLVVAWYRDKSSSWTNCSLKPVLVASHSALKNLGEMNKTVAVTFASLHYAEVELPTKSISPHTTKDKGGLVNLPNN